MLAKNCGSVATPTQPPLSTNHSAVDLRIRSKYLRTPHPRRINNPIFTPATFGAGGTHLDVCANKSPIDELAKNNCNVDAGQTTTMMRRVDEGGRDEWT